MSSMVLAGLREASAALAAEDPAGLPAPALAEGLVELRRLIEGLEAQWMRWLEAFDRGGGAAATGAASTAAWVRSECRLAPGVARDRVELARALPRLPDTASALSAGQISVGHARLVAAAIAELTEATGPQFAAEVEPALVDVARSMDPARLRRELTHVRHALAPEATAAAAERAYRRRWLSVSETFGGTVAVNGMLDAEGGAVLLSALTALSSRTGPDDPRSARERRADALVELARQQLDRGELPSVGGERPHLTVVVPLETLERRAAGQPTANDTASRRRDSPPRAAGQPGNNTGPEPEPEPEPGTGGGTGAGTQPTEDHPAQDHRATTPTHATTTVPGTANRMVRWPGAGPRAADTGWAGPICGEAARRLACDAGLSRVIVDGASQPLDVGRRTRTISPALRTALVVRDGGCVWPGCDRPAPFTDAHHLTSWIDGGATALDNLALVCRVHHRTVHEGRWQLTRTAGGNWTATPPGRTGPAPPVAA